MILERFSSGYFKTDLTVVPYEDGPAIDAAVYEYIERTLYASCDTDPMFRFSLDRGEHFQPTPEYSMPADTLGVPKEWYSLYKIDQTTKRQPVFILKPGYAHLMEQMEDFYDRRGR